ncbi:MAG: hypothetical protein Q7K43_05355, partial [Candidatus Woesearchaeota archaeon]|nr:hypothetical protein [Candidatus Woesearchaeota archaeon]
MKRLVILAGLFMLCLLTLSLVTYASPQCPYGCKYAGFVCCEPGNGVFNHYNRYDSRDGSGECWASCTTKTAQAQVKEQLPDFIVDRLEMKGAKGYSYLSAFIKNQGKGLLQNKNNEDKKIKIEQSLQEYPSFGKAKERKNINYYRVKNYGTWTSGDGKWTADIGVAGFELIPEQIYMYTLKVNEFGLIPETNTVNNVYKAKVRLTKTGALIVG